jgi:hypothetical protein
MKKREAISIGLRDSRAQHSSHGAAAVARRRRREWWGANRTAHGTNTPTSNTKARRKIVSHPQLAGEWRDIHNRLPSSKSPAF